MYCLPYVCILLQFLPEVKTFIFSEFSGIPLAEASKYTKKFKLNIPWYDIKGISVWCMDHSCYDCRCLSDPTFFDSCEEELPIVRKEKHEVPFAGVPSTGVPSTVVPSAMVPSAVMPSAVETFEEALKGLGLSSAYDAQEEHNPDVKPWCTIVNIFVSNTETRRNYSWKLKEWSHPLYRHCARTTGYTKDQISEETKHMEISGRAAQAASPEQMVETVVRTLRNSREKLQMPPILTGGKFKPFMNDSLANLQNALGIPTSDTGFYSNKPSISEVVPLVDLTTPGNVEEATRAHVLGGAKQVKLGGTQKIAEGIRVPEKRRLSDSYNSLGIEWGSQPKKPRRSSLQDDVSSGNSKSPVVETSGDDLVKIPLSNRDRLTAVLSDVEQIKTPKKSLSLLEMMVAEESRGELELDLSDNTPGNALLVAEARFRKLINMNIIGVIGINKAGR